MTASRPGRYKLNMTLEKSTRAVDIGVAEILVGRMGTSVWEL